MAYFRCGISNIQKFKGTAVDVTDLPSPIASFRSNASGVKLDSLKVLVEAVQSGSGTPSPDNIRPITGWSGANVTRTGKNVWGGETMADDCVNAVNNPTYCTTGTDEIGDYVSLVASYAIRVPFFSAFKANTRYTIRLKVSKEDNPANKTTNIEILYTDGTSTYLNAPTNFSVNNVQEYVIVSSANKTIECIRGNYFSGTARFYYDDCGVMEGVLTADDFVPYNGNTYTISFGDTYYGGELDVTNGVLRVTHQITKIKDLSWTYQSNYTRFYSASIKNTVLPATSGTDIPNGLMCESYEPHTFNSSSNGQVYIDTIGNIFIKDFNYTDTTAWFSAVGEYLIRYPLATPFTIQLTPTQIEQLEENNIWADTGDVSECKYIQISQIGG